MHHSPYSFDEESKQPQHQPHLEFSSVPNAGQPHRELYGEFEDRSQVVGRRSFNGLENLGNTCYMNAALQCLASVEPLVSHFMTHHYSKPFVREFAEAITGLTSSISGTMSPNAFHFALQCKFTAFCNRKQHDTQEFISLTLDHIHELVKDHKAQSIISRCFKGSFDKNFRCSNGHTWDVREDFYEISLPIPRKDERVALEALNAEKLTVGDKEVISKMKGKFAKAFKA
jgi:uncharacterized UBP type Zn finger protein